MEINDYHIIILNGVHSYSKALQRKKHYCPKNMLIPWKHPKDNDLKITFSFKIEAFQESQNWSKVVFKTGHDFVKWLWFMWETKYTYNCLKKKKKCFAHFFLPGAEGCCNCCSSFSPVSQCWAYPPCLTPGDISPAFLTKYCTAHSVSGISALSHELWPLRDGKRNTQERITQMMK